MAGELSDLTLSGVRLRSGVLLRLVASHRAIKLDTEPFLLVLSGLSVSAEVKLMVGCVLAGWEFSLSLSLLSRVSLPTGH